MQGSGSSEREKLEEVDSIFVSDGLFHNHY